MRVPAAAVMAAVSLYAAISDPAQATDRGKQVEVQLYGAGTQSCGKWLADRGNVFLNGHERSWVLGWLSASTYFSGMLGMHLRDTDADAVAAWVDKYCREKPLKNIGDAAQSLIVELAKPEQASSR